MSQDLCSGPPSHVGCRQVLQHLRDLEAASQVQQKLFTRQMSAAADWEIACHCRPAQVLAGDYYDVFRLRPDQVALALGDVAGKGLGASLVMAGLHAMVRSRLPHYAGTLNQFMKEINQYLMGSTPDGMFVTLFLGVLDERTGRLTFVNAGHPYPILLTSQADEPLRLAKNGLPLGALPEVEYEEGEADLLPGSLLTLFSDGVTDARDQHGERFQEQRLLDVLREERLSPAATVLSRIVAAVERFALLPEPSDDIALMVVRRRVP